MKIKNPTTHIQSGKRRGALTVEVALCLPILFTILFGSFELAWANMVLHATESAAYEGARVGIIPGANQQKIETAAGEVLRALGINNFTVSVTPGTIDESTENVEVNVRVPFQRNISFPTAFFTDPTFEGNCLLSREIIRN